MKVKQPTLAEAEYAPGDLVRLRTDPANLCRVVCAIHLRLTGDAETGWEQQTSYGIHCPGLFGERAVFATDLTLIDPAPPRQATPEPEDDEVEVKLFESDKSLPETEPFEAPPFAEQKDGVW